MLMFCTLPLLAGCSTLASLWHGKPSATVGITEKGVDGLTASTPMDIEHITKALHDHYQLLSGMQTDNGTVVRYIEARKAGKPALQISGDSDISRIDILDPALTTASGVKVGTAFSQIYQKAYNVCRRSLQESLTGVLCQAPDSKHISYLFSGQWQGPENLLPADDVLKNWTVSKIIWQR